MKINKLVYKIGNKKIYNFYVETREFLRFLVWNFLSKNDLPSHWYKEKVIYYYKRRIGADNFIETGTYQGEMLIKQVNQFKNISSVEVVDFLYRDAVEKLKIYKNIKLYHGSSEELLGKMITEQEKARTIFWLDGHYSGKGTGRGNSDCPLMNELSEIFSNIQDDYVLLIDDARMFDGTGGYPTIDMVRQFLQDKIGKYDMMIKNDIIRIKVKK